MKNKLTSTGNKWNLFLFAVILTGLFSSQATAQYSGKRRAGGNYGNTGPALYVGFEGLAGIRSFTLNSNYEQFDNVPVIQQGQSVGFVVGGNAVMAKLRFGGYKSSHSTSKEFGLRETTVAVNVSPLQFGSRKPSYFEPYFTVDIDANNISLYGAPLPKKDKLTKVPKDPCFDDHGLPGDPDSGSGPAGPPSNPGSSSSTIGGPSSDPDMAPNGEVSKTYVGTIKAVRASVGAGLVCNIKGRKTFAKLFTEAKYGTSFKTTSTNLDLRETKVSGQFTLNFGVMMGVNSLMLGRR